MISERISNDIPLQMTHLNMVIPILIYTSKPGICLKYISCMSDVYSLRLPIISDVAQDVGFPPGFPTVYRGIYCRKFLTLSSQTSRYICKCIRISID